MALRGTLTDAGNSEAVTGEYLKGLEQSEVVSLYHSQGGSSAATYTFRLQCRPVGDPDALWRDASAAINQSDTIDVFRVSNAMEYRIACSAVTGSGLYFVLG